MPKKPVQESIEKIRQEWMDSVDSGEFREQVIRGPGYEGFLVYVDGLLDKPSGFAVSVAYDEQQPDGWRHFDVWVLGQGEPNEHIVSVWLSPALSGRFPPDLDIPF